VWRLELVNGLSLYILFKINAQSDPIRKQNGMVIREY